MTADERAKAILDAIIEDESEIRDEPDPATYIAAQIREVEEAARREEREACAKIADDAMDQPEYAAPWARTELRSHRCRHPGASILNHPPHTV